MSDKRNRGRHGILLYEAASPARPAATSDTPTWRTDFTSAPDSGFHLQLEQTDSRTSDRDYPLLADGLHNNKGGAPSRHNESSAAMPTVSSLAILIGALVGTAVGFGMYFLHLGSNWCLIVPIVFFVTTVVVAQMAAIGRSTIMRWQTILPFALTSLLAAAQGFLLVLAFKSWFPIASARGMAMPSSAFNLTLQCANGLFLTASNGSLSCASLTNTTTALFLATNQTRTVMNTDLNFAGLVGLLVVLGNILVPVNIFTSFTNGAMLSIVMFSVPLGIATAHATSGPDEPNHILTLLRQLRDVLLRMLHGLLFLTPGAVAFLIASSIANFDKYYTANTVTQIAVLVVSVAIGMATHSLIVLPLIVFVATRCNPFPYFQHSIPAYLFAFGSASSLAALPVAIECIERAKISRSIAHVAMPFGAPLNLNGAALYYPLAMVYMANLAGLGDEWTPSRYLVLFVAGWFGCVATAPVPGGAITDPQPLSFAVLVAADFIFDRMCTVVNLHANIAVTRILAEQLDETFEVQAAHHV
ncbi:hypothetical protein LEN26_018832 [Aphanomyces euteiches]|nr:hypothetical protein LEN26_018832 [Aphanomyces euteiches]KAH9104973.1 hypothetical protein AeMF1_019096 [Aphanomyces euteiches]KAH9194172.1 hypothetical protein AeNC1_003849 [Aphanomyces euteiches]